MEAAASWHVGLTGGIGSGKSTVAAMLQALGAAIIDADAVAHRVTAAGGAAIADITRRFGPELITPEGAVDRARMRSLVFSDAQAKADLEAIVHPLVAREIAQEVARQEAAGARCIVLDIPLLVESRRWRPRLDRIIVVDCRTETQIARVCARNGLRADEVQRIIDAQASRQERLAAADAVVFNEGVSLDELRRSVAQLAACIGL